MKLLAFAASNSSKSINKQLVSYAARLVEDAEVEILDLNDYEIPLYSADREEQFGQPEKAHAFLGKIADSDAVLISFAEHNGSYTAAYKNLFDWSSRITKKVFQDKPVVLLSTSPGARGGASVLATATAAMSFFGGQVIANLAIPSFYENFDTGRGELKNATLNAQLHKTVNQLNVLTAA